jgi:DNA (cytosine-5)-methyltransferase 1
MKVLDLFSGIGGFAYGLEQAGGFSTIAFVEKDPFCRRLLKAHWPHVPQYSDVQQVTGTKGLADMITGGFPCQDVSVGTGGKRSSILGERSSLWQDYLRLIHEIQPNWVIIENVEALLNQGMSSILASLAEAGYDVEWHVIPAYAVGLPHTRKRVWIIAHHCSHRMERGSPFPLQGLRELSWWSPVRGFEDFFQRSSICPSKLCRTLHGIPFGVDRLRAIGNSVVPILVAALGMAIQEWEQAE